MLPHALQLRAKLQSVHLNRISQLSSGNHKTSNEFVTQTERVLYKLCTKQEMQNLNSYEVIHADNISTTHTMHLISARTVELTLAHLLYLPHAGTAALPICATTDPLTREVIVTMASHTWFCTNS